MNIEVELPDLGDEAGDEATISEWHFEEGNEVEEGDELVEVVAGDETIDIPCPVTGILVEKLIEEEDIVRPGDPLAIIECPEEEDFFVDEEEDE